MTVKVKKSRVAPVDDSIDAALAAALKNRVKSAEESAYNQRGGAAERAALQKRRASQDLKPLPQIEPIPGALKSTPNGRVLAPVGKSRHVDIPPMSTMPKRDSVVSTSGVSVVNTGGETPSPRGEGILKKPLG
jgi:hypothetical protein